MSKSDLIEDLYPLSPLQHGLLFHLLCEPEGGVYVGQFGCELRGELDVEAFRRAWQRVLERHTALRAGFVWEGLDEPLQAVRRRVELPLLVEDLRALPAAGRERRLEEYLREDRARGFDPARAPLMRLALFRTADHAHELVWTHHHILLDGWSVQRVVGEVAALYEAYAEGREPAPPPARPYRDYIAWLRGQDVGRAEGFWRRELAGFAAPTPLGIGRGAGGPGRVERRLDEAGTARLQAFARGHGLTVNTLVQGAWALVLSRYAGEPDVVFGATVSGRTPDLPEVEEMVGLFINTLPVRVKVDEDREVLDWLRELQARQAKLREHEHSPLPQVQRWSEVPAGTPLFESILVFENLPEAGPAGAPGRRLGIHARPAREQTNYPLALSVMPGQRTTLRLDFGDGVEADAAGRMLAHLETALLGLVAHPRARLARVELLDDAERRRVVAEWNATGRPSPREACVHELFEVQAARTPGAAAVVHDGGVVTYRELDERANRLAVRLRRLGVGPEAVAAVCLERSPDLVVAMLAVLKAGGAFLPLDPAYPRERLLGLLEDSGARVLLTGAALGERLGEGWRGTVVCLDADGPEEAAAEEDRPPAGQGGARSLAYVIYTSGSTGRPKGVAVEHASVSGYAAEMARLLELGEGERVLQFASPGFDVVVEEVFPALVSGAAVVVSGADLLEPRELARVIDAHAVSVVELPTAYWHEWVRLLSEDGLSLPAGLRRVLMGGERVLPERLRAWRETGCELVHVFGLTETTVTNTVHRLPAGADAGAGELPIGRPIANNRVYVLDAGLRPAPVGVAGELFIGGEGVARGYLGRPGSTAERFVPDPFSSEPGARLYRTGDRVRWRGSAEMGERGSAPYPAEAGRTHAFTHSRTGVLEFLGRADEQVKVRGYRIEPGEIEGALIGHPAVGEAVVVLREDTPGQKRLVAYVAARDGTRPQAAELRAWLRERLPEHMVPAACVALERLPLTSSGKVDRRALPAPEHDASQGGYVAPRTPAEEALARIWAEVLRLERVGVEDNFFELGGDSILTIQVASRARKAGLRLTPRQIFEEGTIAALALAAEPTPQGEAAAPASAAAPAALPVQLAAEAEDAYPLSPMQEGMLFQTLYAPGSGVYVGQLRFELRGELDADAFRRAWESVLERHTALRTSYHWEEGGQALQVVRRRVELPLVEEDWREVDDAGQEERLRAYLRDDRARGFDPACAPLLRLALFRTGADAWRLVWSFHQMVLDGWSLPLVFRDVMALYEGREAALPEAAPYRRYVDWLRRQDLEAAERWWRRELAGLAAPTPLGIAAAGEPGRYRRAERLLDEARTARLQAFARSHQLTVNTLVQGAWALLLSRYAGERDVVFGTTVSGRPPELPGVEEMVGMFLNTLPVRVRVDENRPALEWLRELQARQVEMREYEYSPLVQVQRWSGLPAGTPLFESIVVFNNYPPGDAGGGDERRLRVSMASEVEQASEPLMLSVVAGRELALRVEFDGARVAAEAAERLCRHLETALQGLEARPRARLCELELLDEAERRRVLEEWNATERPVAGEACLHERFEAQAARTPGAAAVVHAGGVLTYRELDGRANRLARRLRRLGVGPETVVAICLERSADLVVAMLAVLKAGGAFLPLDPDYPRERLLHLLEDSCVRALVTRHALRERVEEGVAAQRGAVVCLDTDAPALAAEEDRPPAGRADPRSLAYVIYTSGSTGRPKGVAVEHASVSGYAAQLARLLELGEGERVLQFASPGFDVVVEEVFPALVSGAAVVVSGADLLEPRELARVVDAHAVSVMELPTAYWHEWVRALSEDGVPLPAGLRRVLMGGERVLPERLRAWREMGCELVHVFGLTETTVTNTVHRLPAGADAGAGELPIGRPIANNRVYVLDLAMRPVPVGVPGELFIGGEGVARGYLGRPGPTAERFVPDPFRGEGARLYRTGDRVRWRGDGTLEFLGRADEQVKVRGYRIEPGEIEGALGEHPAVGEAVVVLREDAPGQKRLVSYVTPAPGYRITNGRLERVRVEVWPSHGEYPIYDDLLYRAMAQDEVRNRAYREALARVAAGRVAVDVGTGGEAVLARLCVEAGARKVYAIEAIEASYRQAQARIRELGLEDRIVLLRGDALEVELPEPVDLCVSELIGCVGGAEGAAAILDRARRWLAPGGVMVPGRCVTRVAAVQLPDDVAASPAFEPMGAHYARQILELIGHPLDLRVCLRNLPQTALLSDAGTFEELDFAAPSHARWERRVELQVEREGRLDGFLLWIRLHVGDGPPVDSLRDECAWLPLFFPAFDPGVTVGPGDVVRAVCSATPAGDGVHPDYHLEGVLRRADGSEHPFAHHSYHHGRPDGLTSFHRRLLDGGDVRVHEPAAADGVSPAELRAHLAERLPDYMVPGALVVLERLPLTPNGKVDRRALPAPEGTAAGRDPVAPRTQAEEALAEVWREVLRLERVGVHDDFFELGGDSILSIQIVARARQAGLRVTPRQLFEHPTVAELAAVAGVEGGAPDAEQGVVQGPVELTPIQRGFFAEPPPAPHHWNLSVLFEVRGRLDGALLARAVERVAAHHDALRMRFRQEAGEWRQENPGLGARRRAGSVDLSALGEAEQRREVERHAAGLQASLSLEEGRLLRAVAFDRGEGRSGRLLIVVHHLVMDGVSWRIVLEDLQQAYEALARGERVALPPKTTSFRRWAGRLAEHVAAGGFAEELPYWLAEERRGVLPLPQDLPGGANTVAEGRSVSARLDEEETRRLLQEVPRAYRTQINDVLLTALARVLGRWAGEERVLVDVEGHGREEVLPDVDLSRTVGWFTTLYPVLLDLRGRGGEGRALQAVKEQLRAVPNRGIGHGALRWLGPEPGVRQALAALPAPQVRFEYLGQLDQSLGGEAGLFALAPESAGPDADPRTGRGHLLALTGAVLGGRLDVTWQYSAGVHREETVRALAREYVAELRRLVAHCTSEGAGGRTPSDFPLARVTQEEVDRLVGSGRGVEELYRLSPMQEGMLFHTLLAPGSGVYVVQFGFELRGELDVEAFRRAWRGVVQRHAVLRTRYVWEGVREPMQLVQRGVELPLAVEDWGGMDAIGQAARLEAYLREDRARGFDLTRAPLLRLALFRRGPGAHRLVLSLHMMVLDGWSVPLLFRDAVALYDAHAAGREPALPPARPYRAYVAWLARQDLERAERWWRRELAGFDSPTPLAPLLPPGEGAAGGYGRAGRRLGSEAAGRLQAFARGHGLTVNTLVQGAWALLLSRYSGEPDVVFGATVSGRPPELAGVEEMVGLFINTLPVRVRVDEDREVLDWLRELQARQAELREYDYSPLAQVQRWSEVPAGTPLFESLVVFNNYPVAAAAGGGGRALHIAGEPEHDQTNYPLALSATLTGDDLVILADYARERFGAAGVERLLGHLAGVLEWLAAADGRRLAGAEPLAGEERDRLLRWADGGPVPDGGEPTTVHALFAAQAARTPGVAALSWRGEVLTYAALDERANRLAHRLRRLGVGPEARVAVCMERTPDLVVALLAVLKAGGAYVPVDPAYPAGRIALMLEDSGAPVLLTQAALAGRLPAHAGATLAVDEAWPSLAAEPATDPAAPVAPRNLAYAIYTSGSTGRPKGVQIEHRSTVAFLRWLRGQLSDAERRSVLGSTSVSFDVSVAEVFGTLCWGGTLVLARDALELAELPGGGGVVTACMAPSAAAELLRAGALPPSLRVLNLAGEALPSALARDLNRVPTLERVVNLYGPTEDTTYSTWCTVPPEAARVAIGRPLAGTRAYVLDRGLRLAPEGVAGELCLGGLGVSRGYLGRPALTAERFVPDPFGAPGGRLYRTGDRARWGPGGQLEYLGRLDRQVKVRGYRVEPGEVEGVLAAFPGVREAAVVVREDRPGDRRLVAYVAADADEATPARLRAWALERLPEYMVPAAFVVLERLPLSPNGKVDRAALPAPDHLAGPGRGYVAPRTPAEELVAGIWEDVLGRERVGADDDFFELGGHSLLATRVASRVGAAFGVRLPLRALFETPTVAGVAAHVEALLRAGSRVELPPISPAARDRELPLSFAQQRLWLLHQLEAGGAYNIPAALRLTGALDAAALAWALGEVARRHEVLRTTFRATADGRPVQVVGPPAPARLPVADLSALEAGARDREARRLAREEAVRRFDLERGPLHRCTLLRLGADDAVILFTLHHVAGDGWSMEILVREVSALYRAYVHGEPPALPALPVQYADYAAWQRRWLEGGALERELAYWRGALAGAPAVLDLPAARPRPPRQGFRGRTLSLSLAPELAERLARLGRRESATPNLTLMAAFAAVLFRYTGQEKVVIGSLAAGRTRREVEDLIGFFVNLLPLCVDLSGDPTLLELLRRVRATALDAYTHQDVPFDRLLEELQLPRLPGVPPLVQAVFAYERVPDEGPALPGVSVRPLEGVADDTARFDLALTVVQQGDALAASLAYDTALFDEGTARQLLADFHAVAAALAERPEMRVLDVTLAHAAPGARVPAEAAEFDFEALGA